MRVTQGMIATNMMRNISSSYDDLDTHMNQLSSGKKITRPSDDPVTAVKGIDYHSQSSAIEQYKRNTDKMHTWLDNSDAALDKSTQAMQKIKELAVQATNDTNGEKERESISKEVKEIKEHVVDIANTKVNGEYIFNGTDTDKGPVDTANETFPKDIKPVDIEVADGVKIPANVDSESILDKELFNEIDKFVHALEGKNESSESDIEKSIDRMDKHVDNVIDSRADVGARMSRLELTENRLEEQEEFTGKALANNEDVDYEKVITELKTQETMHRAALAAGSRVIQPSLIDFLS